MKGSRAFQFPTPAPTTATSSDGTPSCSGQTILGVDIGGTKTAIAWASHTGEILKSARISTPGDARPEDLFDRIAEAAARLHRADAPPAAVALAAPGIADAAGVRLAPNIAGWEYLALGTALSRRFPDVPTTVLNDVRSATLAELTDGGLVGVSNGIYVNLGTGVSSGIVVNGEIVSGHDDAAGEIAYQLTIPHRSAPAQLELVFSDGHAPLEEAFSGLALSRALGLDAEELETVESHDRIREWMLAHSEHLARSIANLSIALNPERVVIGGGTAARAPYILDGISELVNRTVPYPPRVVLSNMPNDAALRGTLITAARSLGRNPTTAVI